MIPTAGLPGKPACSAARPSGVGVSAVPEFDDDAPLRIGSQYVLPKKNNLSLMMGPPMVPPYLFSTTRGTETGREPVEGLTPGGQKPASELLSCCSNDCRKDP